MDDEPRCGAEQSSLQNRRSLGAGRPEASVDEMRRAGARLRTVRRTRGLTQGELATATGVSRSAVAQWETGRASCGGRLRAIAAALNVPIRELQTAPRSVGAKRSPIEASSVNENDHEFIRLLRLLDGDDQARIFELARRLATASRIDDVDARDEPASVRSGAERRLARSG